ncbi:MAG TPA: RDD family protein [Longimicrobium sp.]|jgi:uncharacterized RDD family membrane protein YckC
MMDIRQPDKAEVMPQEWEYVGFFPRFGAMTIDTIIELVLILVLLHLLGAGVNEATGVSDRPLLKLLIDTVLPTIATILFWKHWRATPGKMLIGAQIVDVRTGEAASTWQLTARYLGYYLSLLPLGLGFFWVLFDSRKQGWHDKLSRTAVVRVRVRQARVSSPALNQHRQGAREWTLPEPPPSRSAGGVWVHPTAAEGCPTLVQVTPQEIRLATIASSYIDTAVFALSRGEPVPAQHIPLGAVESIYGDEESSELTISYRVAPAGTEQVAVPLAGAAERMELLSVLARMLGPGWHARRVRTSRFANAWQILLLMGVVWLCSLGLEHAAAEMAKGVAPEIQGDNVKEKIGSLLVFLLAGWLGPEGVRVCGYIALGVCALLLVVVSISPPMRIELQRDWSA